MMKKIYLYIMMIAMMILLAIVGGCRSKKSTDRMDEQHQQDKETVWTCSMHPQVKMDKQGKCPMCGMDLIPMEEESEEGPTSEVVRLSDSAMALAEVEVTVVGRGASASTKHFTGRIVADESAKEVQVSYLRGRLDKSMVTHEGQVVSRGQSLGLMYSPQVIELQKELALAKELKNTQPEIYAALRSKMKLLKFTEEQMAMLEEVKEPLVHFPVYVTVGGTVSKLFAAQGDEVKVGQPLFEVIDLSKVWVELDVLEREAQDVRLGQKVEVHLAALPGRVFASVVDYVSPVVDTQKGTLVVRATVDNNQGVLKTGMLVDAVVHLSPKTMDKEVNALIVPRSAVLWTGKRSVVYVQEKPGEYLLREVHLGESVEGAYKVVGGLAEGEYVVTNGAFTVDASAQLAGLSSMVNRKKLSGVAGMSKKVHHHSGMAQEIDVRALFVEYNLLTIALYKDDFKSALTHMVALNKVIQKKAVAEKDLRKAADKGVQAKDIKMLRTAYETVSTWMVAQVRKQGLGQKAFIQYCPMVHGDTGAAWVSLEKEINNPYFGSMMLHCGEVQEVIE